MPPPSSSIPIVPGRPRVDTADPIEGDSARIPLRRERGPRLGAYAALGLTGVVLGLATSRVELVVLGAPFLLLAALAVGLATEPDLRLAVVGMSPRLVEGDRLDVELELTGDRVLTVEAILGVVGPVRLDDPGAPLAVMRRVGPEPLRWLVEPETRHWGLIRVDEVVVRVHGLGGLVRWTGGVTLRRTVRVLPAAPRGRRLLPATEPRSTAGSHMTRLRGDGSEFADLRTYQPGDSLRSVNWKASARRGELMANLRHPERATDVVLVIDTTDDGSGYPPVGLLQAVRVAWVLADLHLTRQDRVGAVLFGRGLRWTTPRGGQRGREQLFEELLAVTSPQPRRHSRMEHLPHQVIPPGATVVALTTLQGDVFARAIGTLRRQGHEVAAVVIDPTPLLADDLAGVVPGALRLWRMEVEQRRRRLAARGVRTISVPAGAPPDVAVAGLTAAARSRVLTR
ncbi:MAG TPA: DUF58 domain-containing protein [Iamia sp.]